MKKLVSLIAICLLIFSCKSPVKQNATVQATTDEEISSASGRDTYAVVWDWLITDDHMVGENTGAFTTELMALWKNDDIENVYFNTDAGLNTEIPFPTISFFIKAHSPEDAQLLLDSLTIVKKGNRFIYLTSRRDALARSKSGFS